MNAAKVESLKKMIGTLQAVGKNKKQILQALVKSGAKIRDARRIYKEVLSCS